MIEVPRETPSAVQRSLPWLAWTTFVSGVATAAVVAVTRLVSGSESEPEPLPPRDSTLAPISELDITGTMPMSDPHGTFRFLTDSGPDDRDVREPEPVARDVDNAPHDEVHPATGGANGAIAVHYLGDGFYIAKGAAVRPADEAEIADSDRYHIELDLSPRPYRGEGKIWASRRVLEATSEQPTFTSPPFTGRDGKQYVVDHFETSPLRAVEGDRITAWLNSASGSFQMPTDEMPVVQADLSPLGRVLPTIEN